MFTPALYKVADVGVPAKKINCSIAVSPIFFFAVVCCLLFFLHCCSVDSPPSEEEEEDWRGLLKDSVPA